MINAQQFTLFLSWFGQYTSALPADSDEFQQNFYLKKLHSLKVCEANARIGKALGLAAPELRLAQTIGLFHDIGRFDQYRNYRTFMDSRSINHGELGVRVLQQSEILKHLSSATRAIIYYAVGHHNAKVLPQPASPAELLFGRLVRDADKLDIFRVVTGYYAELKKGNTDKAVALDLPDEAVISDKIYQAILREQIADMKDLRTLNDFKIMQIGWIFDINFPPSFQLIKDGQYLEKIAATLPDIPQTQAIYAKASQYLCSKISPCA
ncbi:MAG: HD domain-containing protein [Candidatus Omnitrophica bacterium]|nr:HD domain-containing protein [Candidatus Omnitrophota bacterium]